ncbi:hypothetical protein [Pantoea sp. ME81]|uniref:hypothetical protein n=1 Tax=Pantoea sp. ME81 TaxID=2743935 RepID=UPI0015F4F982|nr:hypothetical protein [Pantoea sp. ME81]
MSHSNSLIDEAKNKDYFYKRMSGKDGRLVYFPGNLPVTFIKNPLNLKMQLITLEGCGGGIFYKPEALHDAYQLYLAITLLVEAQRRCRGLGSALPKPSDSQEVSVLEAFKGKIPNQGGLDPHAGLEYLLMYTKQKKVAYFLHSIPSEFYSNPLGLSLRQRDTPCGLGVIYYVEGKEKEAENLFFEIKSSKSALDFDANTRIGKILGYKSDDIDEYNEFLVDRSSCRSSAGHE